MTLYSAGSVVSGRAAEVVGAVMMMETDSVMPPEAVTAINSVDVDSVVAGPGDADVDDGAVDSGEDADAVGTDSWG